jgi:hypothetical protein
MKHRRTSARSSQTLSLNTALFTALHLYMLAAALLVTLDGAAAACSLWGGGTLVRLRGINLLPNSHIRDIERCAAGSTEQLRFLEFFVDAQRAETAEDLLPLQSE